MNDWLDICLPFVERWEGCKLHAYPDPATGGEPYTVGWGSTGPDIDSETVWTQEQADADLLQRLIAINRTVAQAVRVRLSPSQRAALVSLIYNIGRSAFLQSTLLRMLNAGDYAGAHDQFGKWVKAGGRVMAGLTARRAAEADLFEDMAT